MEFEVVPADVPEVGEGADPESLVLQNARAKAAATLDRVGAGEGRLVLGADTDVLLDGRILGKPGSRAEARERLLALSGRTHEVLSGLVLLSGGAPERAGVARTAVSFRRLPERTLHAYLDSEEWRDRAGGYAVQGLGSLLVDRVQGDLSNVIGLPLNLLLELAPELLPPRIGE